MRPKFFLRKQIWGSRKNDDVAAKPSAETCLSQLLESGQVKEVF